MADKMNDACCMLQIIADLICTDQRDQREKLVQEQ